MKIEQVAFCHTAIEAFVKDGKPFIAVKPICEALGLDWSKQLRSLKSDPVLSSTMDVSSIVGADGKTREMVCLPLDYLNGWLFKIDARRRSC